MCTQHIADGFGVCADAFDSRHEVAAVALKENRIFSPVVVLVVFCPLLFKELVVLGFGVEHESSAHDVAVSTEDFGETANHNIGIW